MPTLVLLGYLTVSFLYFGVRLLPHPGRLLVGSGQDPVMFVWSFAWWPYAIAHGTNPFVTHLVYAPQGIDLAWTATTPGLALVFAPATLAFGPVVAYNLAACCLPALAAFTAYLLCRYLTRSLWASLVGGYLFGFSSYILGQQLEGHLHLTGVFLLPLLALAVVRYLDGVIGARGLTWRVAALIGCQLWISTEFALTATLALAAGLGLTAAFAPAARPRLRSALLPLLEGYALAALVAAPLLFYVLDGFQSGNFTGSSAAVTDLANLVVPTQTNLLAGNEGGQVAAHFNQVEAGLYLGPPALLIAALFAWRFRRSAGARVVLTGLALAVVLALGTSLDLDGKRLLPLPWRYAVRLPLLDNTSAGRFAAFAALAVAVVVALWTARTAGRVFTRPFVLPVLAVAALVPAVTLAAFVSDPGRPAFFADSLYKRCLPRGSTALVFPFGHADYSMLWQAESGFWFRLAEGYLYVLAGSGRPVSVSAFDTDPTARELEYPTGLELPTVGNLLGFAGRHGVGRVLVVDGSAYPSRSQLRAFGRVGTSGGMLVAPACGAQPLRSADLAPYVLFAAQESGANVAWCDDGRFYTLPFGLYLTGEPAATPALYIAGVGATCGLPPAGDRRDGFAPASLGVPPHTYPYFRRHLPARLRSGR